MLVFLAPLLAAATCDPPTIKAGVPGRPKGGYDKAWMLGADAKPAAELSVTAEGLLAPTYAVGSIVRWGEAASPGETCDQRIEAADATALPDAGPQAAKPPGKPAPGSSLRERCMQVAKGQGISSVREERTSSRTDDFSFIVFSREGPCWWNRDFGITGDPIYVGFYTEGSEVGPALTVDPCALEPAGPQVLISADISGLTVKQADVGRIERFTQRSCFNTAVGLKVEFTGTGNVSKSVSMTLQQYQRYRATLQVGALFTEQHVHTFGLRAAGGTKLIADKGPADRGPEYVALVTLYGLPHYIEALGGRRYLGRDPVNENSFADRVGLVLGVGLESPAKRFGAGLSFELLTGINVVAVREFARLTELNGVVVNDPFAGAAEDIPTRERWQQRWVVGIGIDARYALALFSRK